MTQFKEKAGKNREKASVGLYAYPNLMAADILAFNAHQVPVGRDQIQHIEMARDIAQRFNHIYGRDFFVLPEALIEAQVATLPGLDGRKMSKSYDNTIPLFAGGAKATREAIMRIVTDSRLPGEPKDPDSAALFTLFRAFASEAESQAFRTALEEGIGWGEAKQVLFDRIETDVAPMRARYDELMAKPAQIEAILQEGAAKARAIAMPLIAELRDAIGLRSGAVVAAASPAAASAPKTDKPPRFASFRDGDGRFRFRLFSGDGEELLLSQPFDDPKAAGALQKRLRTLGGVSAVVQTLADGTMLELDGVAVARLQVGEEADAVDLALARLRHALDQLAAQD